MYYRLRPPADVTWINMPMIDDRLIAEHHLDLDRLNDEWQPTDDRQFSLDLLRIALRHGVTTSSGLAVNAEHTTDLGRSDTLRVLQQQAGEIQGQIRDSQTGQMLEQLMPGWRQSGIELDARVRESSEHAAREADEDLAAVLSAPIRLELAEHWRKLGGVTPEA